MAIYPDLRGRSVIVTGAAQNIGRGIAEAFLGQGANVLLADIQEDKGEATATALAAAAPQELGGRVLFRRVDVTQAHEIAAMVACACETWGRLDIVVSNARWERVAPITALEPEDWDRTHAVHLRSHYLAAKYAIPAMVAGGGGCLISISSVQGIGVSPQHAAYCSAKAAVNQLVRQIADEYGPQGIRANAILPGSVITERKVAAWREHPELEARTRRLHPAGRPVMPVDIARLALFLASDDASMITGQAIVIDGGLTLALPTIVASRVLDER